MRLTRVPAVFALADYRRLWGIGAGVGVGRWLEMLALSIYVFQLTQSPTLVAVTAIVRMLPYALFGLIVASLADHIDRRRLLAVNLVLAVTTAATMAVLARLGHASYPVVLIVTGLLGLLWVTDMPVRRRMMADAVGIDRVPAALGFDNATNYATRAVGPLLGGIVYQWLGVEGIFALSATIYAVCAWLAVRLEIAASPADRTLPRPHWRALVTPPADLIRNRTFLVFLGVTAVYNLWCFPVLGMVPVIAQKNFALSPAAVGALAACDGIGGTIGALLVGIFAGQAQLFPIYFYGTTGLLLLLALLSTWLTVPSAVAGFLLVGACASLFSATQYGLVYSLARPEHRGRATGVLSLFISLATIGHFHTGLMFDWFTSRQALAIIATEGLLAMLALWWLWRRTLAPAT
jgi:MFS family permease